MTHYRGGAYKFEEAARRGAIARLIIHRADLASYRSEALRNSWGKERSYLQRNTTPTIVGTVRGSEKLVAMAGLDLDKLFEQAQSMNFDALVPIGDPEEVEACGRQTPNVLFFS